MMNNLYSSFTILVNSCDLYEDSWKPFFTLLKTQWPDCGKAEIILNSETKRYECDFLDISTFCGGLGIPWSKRLINCLNNVSTEYVLFFLDDEFLLESVNVNELNRLLDYMNNNSDVGVIYPHKTNKQTIPIEENYFSRDLITKNKRLVCICALWRKSYLLKVLRESESPWEFEHNAPERSKKYPDRILQYNKSLPNLIVYDDQVEIGYGITAKKWLPKTKELFKKYDIEVNYDNLGFYPYENQVIAAKEEAKLSQASRKKVLNPIELLYSIKKKIKNIDFSD